MVLHCSSALDGRGRAGFKCNHGHKLDMAAHRGKTGNGIAPADSSRYTITFNSNGSLNIQADCNWGGGKYTVEGNTISIEIDHTTRALCPPDSLDKIFIGHLNSSESFYFKENNLFIKLKNNAGTMEFKE
jgi:heat shock protein HslJ